MANIKGNSTAGHELTQAQAMAKFSGKTFKMDRTKLKVKSFVVDTYYVVTYEAFDECEDEWVSIECTFKSFLRDKPTLITV